MTYDPEKHHHRRSIRLKGYDYSQAGAYFVTLCAQDRACLFGEVVDGEMRLNDAGRMVEKWWDQLNHKFSAVQTDEYIVMPNHFYGIVVIQFVGAGLCVRPNEPDRTGDKGAHTNQTGAHTNQTGAHTGAPLPEIVQWFKTMTTNEYIRGVKQSGWPPFYGRLWQRNYYEHIIRNDESLNRIREYIINNPLQWALDRENPNIVGTTHASPLPKDKPWRT